MYILCKKHESIIFCMSDISVNQKLALAQQIRAQNAQNEGDMSQRRQVLYGGEEILEENRSLRSFRIRMIVTILLVCALLLADQFPPSFFRFDMNQVYEMLSEDFLNNKK